VIDEHSTLEAVCFEVAATLDRVSIRAVLTGGSAATVYSAGAYTSEDVDFVLASPIEGSQLQAALASIGFERSATDGMFAHPRTKFTIDFPKGPLAVGGDYIRETAILENDGMQLHILTPTDCVLDRLGHFYHWKDYTALNAAVAVARLRRQEIDLDRLRDWTERESAPGGYDHRPKFEEFLRRLRTGPVSDPDLA
jgi:hypothetical protein